MENRKNKLKILHKHHLRIRIRKVKKINEKKTEKKRINQQTHPFHQIIKIVK